MSYFRSQPFFKGLALEGLRKQACSFMFRERVDAGAVLWHEGSDDVQTFHIVLRGGPVREVKNGETIRKLKMGDEIGGQLSIALSVPRAAHRCHFVCLCSMHSCAYRRPETSTDLWKIVVATSG